MLGPSQGGFAKCYMFTSLSKNKILAGKVVLKSSLVKERAKQKLLAEIKIHRDMCHTSIVRFESFFEDKTAVYILLELCANNVSLRDAVDSRRVVVDFLLHCLIGCVGVS
jgi:serine/threonine protein kinase